ncbi:MAG: hypothetical protein AAF483_10635 [Planctomycetota bacterium]
MTRSTRGLKLKNDRTDRHFRDTVANQVRTSLSSLKAANDRRKDLVQFQTGFYEQSLATAKDLPQTAYLLTGTSSRTAAAALLLSRHQIRSFRPDGQVLVDGQRFLPQEILVIPTEQPEFVFLKSMMEPLQDFRENIFYDVSTWHVPSAFDLTMHRCESDLPESWLAAPGLTRNEPDLSLPDFETAAGLVFSPTELAAPSLATALQQASAHLRVATESFFNPGESGLEVWPLGSYVLLKQPNEKRWKNLASQAWRQAKQRGISVAIIASSMTPKGPDMGSGSLLALPTAKPLLLVGQGTRSYSAGALWHHLDTRLKLPATLVDDQRLGNVKLDEFTCVIMPEGSYSSWSEAEIQQLKDYLRSGGTLIAVASAIRRLQQSELLPREEEPEVNASSTSQSEVRPFGNARQDRALESIAGAFLSAKMDATHPLAYGFPDDRVPLFRDHSMRFAKPSNSYGLVASYQSVIAGYVSKRNRQRLQSSAAVWAENVGSGRIICLADNPVFRGYVRSSERFLTNAILLGPVVQIPSSPTEEQASSEGHGHGHNH